MTCCTHLPLSCALTQAGNMSLVRYLVEELQGDPNLVNTPSPGAVARSTPAVVAGPTPSGGPSRSAGPGSVQPRGPAGASRIASRSDIGEGQTAEPQVAFTIHECSEFFCKFDLIIEIRIMDIWS